MQAVHAQWRRLYQNVGQVLRGRHCQARAGTSTGGAEVQSSKSELCRTSLHWYIATLVLNMMKPAHRQSQDPSIKMRAPRTSSCSEAATQPRTKHAQGSHRRRVVHAVRTKTFVRRSRPSFATHKTGQAAEQRLEAQGSAHLLNIWLSLTGFDWQSHLPTHEGSTPAAEDVFDAGAGAGAGDG